MTRSSYSIIKVTPEKVWLVDNDLGGLSVTNDAEDVCEAVNTDYPGRRIIYRDSDGRWDELCHKNGIFIGYANYNEELP